MNRSDLKDWTREMLEAEIINMNAKNFQLQNEADRLMALNKLLQAQIESKTVKASEITDDDIAKHFRTVIEVDEKTFKDVLDRFRHEGFENTEEAGDEKCDSDIEAVIQELEEEHQSDCNKIAELTTTIKVLAEVISNLKFRLDNC